MGNSLNEFEKIFIQHKVSGKSNKESYQLAKKHFKENVTDGSAKVLGSGLNKKLEEHIEEAKKLKEAETEAKNTEKRITHAKNVKEMKQKEKLISEEGTENEINNNILTYKKGVLQARSLLFCEGVKEFRYASANDNPAYKASIFKSCADLLKLEAPEEIDFSKIDFSKPSEEVLKSAMDLLGNNPQAMNLLLKGFEAINRKEREELKEASKIVEALEKIND